MLARLPEGIILFDFVYHHSCQVGSPLKEMSLAEYFPIKDEQKIMACVALDQSIEITSPPQSIYVP